MEITEMAHTVPALRQGDIVIRCVDFGVEVELVGFKVNRIIRFMDVNDVQTLLQCVRELYELEV